MKMTKNICVIAHKCLKFVSKSLFKLSVPMITNNNFVYYTQYPVFSSNFSKRNYKKITSKIAIIIQGPILINDNFTIETIKIYKTMFEGQNVEIILTCLNDENNFSVNQCKKLGVHVVQSDKIEYSGRGNLNFQIITTKAGIKKAKELGCEYILKTRSDQRFYKTDIFEYFMNLLNVYPLQGKSSLKKRIIACSFNSFIYRNYGVSDMFLFGTINDMEKYWNIPFDNANPVEWRNLSQLDFFKNWSPETYITKYFLNNISHNIKNTLEDSLNCYINYFIFVDKEQLMFYWPKYSNKTCRWEFFYPNPMDEIKYIDWLNLYIDREKIKYYISQNWLELPKF